MDRLARKFETARERVPGPVIKGDGSADLGIIAYGTSHWAVAESVDQLDQERGLKAGYCRLRAFPFALQVADFVRRHQRVYVVDHNRDGQMYQLLRLELDPDEVKKLRTIRYYAGLPLDARTVTDAIVSEEVKK